MDIPQILVLDTGGSPRQWATWERAVFYHAKGLVAWQMGEHDYVFRGGTSSLTGERSRITTQSIIAVAGPDVGKTFKRINREPPLKGNTVLFRRDQHVCAYCANVHIQSDLTRDHITPLHHGGKDRWMNLVTACWSCNHRKANRTPEQAGMKLVYVPFIPNRHEYLILKNRKILSDQMEFLLVGVPANSRVRQ